MRSRTTAKLSLAAGVLAIVLSGGTSSAAKIGHVIAIPGSSIANYATKPVVITRGSTAAFHNFDIAPHDVVSDSGLFWTPLIGALKAVDIAGVSSLGAGTYGFHCSIHPAMHANLIVR